ncbi:MAG: arsenate reductase family protein [Actinomycetota bacterium]|nr:arsenate reductase family protein [Actinomycetota bacterium]
MEIWVNPSCSKCQAATQLLDEAGATYTVRRYLDDPPTADELDGILRRLGLDPWDVARINEPLAEELGLSELPHERGRWIELMIAHPVLIQRPIITADDGTTVLGRSEDAVRGVLARTRRSEGA